VVSDRHQAGGALVKGQNQIMTVAHGNEVVKLESRPCPLGCPPNDALVLTGRDRLQGLPGEFRIVRCRTCGLMRTNPRPTRQSIGTYYPESYGPYQGTRVDPSARTSAPAWRQSLRKWIRRLVKLHVDSVPELKPGRMLEIGCASGVFLHRMAADGWQVEGIEFSESAAASARALGYRVHAGALETAPDPQQPYDLVAGWMVMEHLHEPVRALRKLQTWTRPNAWLAFSVPNAACFQLRLFGNRWYPLHLPNHLYHYTLKTLPRVLDLGGWELREIIYQRDTADLFASVGNTMKDHHWFPRLADRLALFPETQGKIYLALYPVSWLLSAAHESSRLTVWAQRKDD
jgi:2-polyprenyl-3-methyl-5-hydroxy-6-metoxy-1,4-benzoquinol methylase